MSKYSAKNRGWQNTIKTESDWKIMDIEFFGRSGADLLKKLVIQLKSRDKGLIWIATVNPEFVMKTVEDKGFFRVLQKKTLNIADGVGLIWAKKVKNGGNWLLEGINVLRGKFRDEVIAGSSLMGDLCRVAAREKMKVFFLGGWEDRAARAAGQLKIKNEKLKVGSCKGRPEFSDEEVLAKIAKYRPKILFVAYGMKTQEEWIDRKYEELQKAGVGLVMGVGRSLDYYSGDLKRAPEEWRRMGLEWLYSLIQEPVRWRRQLVLPRFVLRVICGC